MEPTIVTGDENMGPVVSKGFNARLFRLKVAYKYMVDKMMLQNNCVKQNKLRYSQVIASQ